ncbi:ABC transporter permease [Sanguibacter sp. 4.1]|uniref:Transport permease protein n=1 Tax=Sanguibacter biliveldensis TaxID=3030830 RepID=A0AAF0Z5X8_9MICO|nr:ABC transporter permease [Sanguibacter sp. 4.1]WPF81712.1 ABC transporter permease [Sanguibacter sp. 4.1]
MSGNREPIVIDAWDERNLLPIGHRPPISKYLRSLWLRRHFILEDSRARVSSSTRSLLLGNAWLAIRPLLDGLVYLVIFGGLLGSGTGVENFTSYLLIGVFMFQFTIRSMTTGASAVVANKNLLRSFVFPRAALPISAVIRETINTIPVITVMMILIVAIPPHAEITWRWVLFPIVFALQLILNMGIAMTLARAVSQVRDLTNLIGFGARVLLYTSGVFYSLEHFVSHPTVLAVMSANPLYQILEITRQTLLYGTTPDLESWAILAAWAFTVFGAGLIYFWRGEERYGRVQ